MTTGLGVHVRLGTEDNRRHVLRALVVALIGAFLIALKALLDLPDG